MATTVDVAVLEAAPAIAADGGTGVSQWPANVWKFCRRKPLGAVGGFIVLVMLLTAVFVNTAVIAAYSQLPGRWPGQSIFDSIGDDRPLLALSGYNDQNIRAGERDQGASFSHPMGTDEFGRDIFSRILYGARIAAVVGFSAVTVAAALSLMLGTISGYFSGCADTIIQRVINVILAIPPLILLIFGLTVFAARAGPYTKMLWITLIIGFILAAASVRVVRSAALSTAANQYVDAARTIGATDMRIVFRHIMPNVLPVVIVLATVQLGTALLVSAAVSFLGLGIPPPFPDWGVMLGQEARTNFVSHPIQSLWPGIAIALAVYGFNMLGDALRDVLDPRLRGSR